MGVSGLDLEARDQGEPSNLGVLEAQARETSLLVGNALVTEVNVDTLGQVVFLLGVLFLVLNASLLLVDRLVLFFLDGSALAGSLFFIVNLLARLTNGFILFVFYDTLLLGDNDIFFLVIDKTFLLSHEILLELCMCFSVLGLFELVQGTTELFSLRRR
jgi:hypothetical protein